MKLFTFTFKWLGIKDRQTVTRTITTRGTSRVVAGQQARKVGRAWATNGGFTSHVTGC